MRACTMKRSSRQPDNASTFGKVLSGGVTNLTQKIHLADQLLITGVSAEKRQKLSAESNSTPGCKRSDLLLAANYTKRAVAGSHHVFSLDDLDFTPVTRTLITLNGISYQAYVPMDMAQFQCDIYDARDHRELSLAMMQCCYLEIQTQNSGVTVKSPDHRCYNEQGEFVTPRGNSIVLRRNVIVIDTHQVLQGTKEAKIKFVRDAFHNVPNFQHMKFYIADKHGNLPASDLKELVSGKPKCIIDNQTMEPPIISYSGIAMTDAFYNASNGDTFVTSNVYSLMTVNNGPVPACHGDTLHWFWNIETHYYNEHGVRQKRALWYKENNTQRAENNENNGHDLRIDTRNYRDSAAESRVGRRFYVIPFKMGFCGVNSNLAPQFGVLDSMNQRKVGIAQCNAGAYASIDMTNCGKCIN